MPSVSRHKLLDMAACYCVFSILVLYISQNLLTFLIPFLNTFPAINELTENMVPNYNSISTLYSGSSDVTERATTIDKDGWIQGVAKTSSQSGDPFVRLYINGVIAYEANGPAKNYSYVWSPLLRVKKGDIVKYTLTTETSDGLKELRFYLP